MSLKAENFSTATDIKQYFRIMLVGLYTLVPLIILRLLIIQGL